MYVHYPPEYIDMSCQCRYRIAIGDAVPYDVKLVHDKMIDDPGAFVRWYHAPHDNFSICQNYDAGAFIDPSRINSKSYSCSFEIHSAAYDFAQPAVRAWFLDNIHVHTCNQATIHVSVADRAWLDGGKSARNPHHRLKTE